MVPIEDVTTVAQFQRALQKPKQGTAFGYDGVPCELLRLAPRTLAERSFGVMLKLSVLVMEPFQSKGGEMVPL